MIHPLLRPFSASLFAWWLYFVLSPAQTGGPPSEHVRQPADDPIARQEQDQEEAVLYFPDYVDGGGWSVQLALSNAARRATAAIVVAAYDQEGRPVPELFDSETAFEIPPLGSRVLSSAGTGPVRRGWIEVRTEPPSVSGLLTYRNSESGVEVGVAPVELGDRFALFVEESSVVGSGLAVFKPDPDSRIELRIRDESGRDPLDDLFIPWRDFRQSARTISEWFDVDGVDRGFLRDFRGLLFLRTADGSPFAPLGLRFGKGTGALSAVPVIRIVDGVRIDGGVEIEGGVGIDGGGHAPPPTVTLSVSPKSIDRGQSATLRWSSTRAESAEITPDIGEVPTSGTRRVSPTRTTTYRITVRSADGQTATESMTVTVAVSEQQALEALYVATDGPNWVNNENWLTDAPLGEWFGVTTNPEGRVVRLKMSYWDRDAQQWISNNLSGPIPPEFGELSSLDYVDFYNNSLTGSIPPELGRLANLTTLDFNQNDLTGPIPPELGNLDNLHDLNLDGNDLTGMIPPELGDLGSLSRLGLWGNDLTGPIPPQLGGLSSLTRLNLYGNELSGPIPDELGNLANLASLNLSGNELTGPIPQSFLRLDRLVRFYIRGNESLCVPGTSAFLSWLRGIEHRDDESENSFCNGSDVAVLDSLYRATGGPNWTHSDGWLGEGAVSEWYGIRTDPLGRVTGLDLSDNGLEGRLPATLGQLAQLTELRVADNADLSDRLPLSLTQLSFQTLHYSGTGLCAPADASFRDWLSAIPSHEGTGVECPPFGEWSPAWEAYLNGQTVDATYASLLPPLFRTALQRGLHNELDSALARLVLDTPALPTSSSAPLARLSAKVAETLGPYEWLEPHPWAAVFPGLPAEDAHRVDGTVTVDATRRAFPADASRRESHLPLGFYAPPGALVTIEVPAGHATGKLRVSVGELHDDLGEGYAAKPMWRRAPWLRREFPVRDGQTGVTNAYGGSIALVVPANYERGRVQVTVRGAIPMAVYTHGESNAAAWLATLDAGAPQAIIQKMGGIRLVISTENARGVDDPGEVSAFWDGFNRHHAELSGEPVPRAFESVWIFDPQVGHGYANAGWIRINYPLHGEHWVLLPGTAEGRAYIARLPDLGPQPHRVPRRDYSPSRDGVDWWLFGHELGHQWQTKDWTGHGITEVGVNLFTMYTLNYYVFGGDDFNIYAEQKTHGCAAPLDHAALANERWPTAGPCERLAMYRQLISEFGWDAMKQVFHSYYDPAYPRSTYGGSLDGFAIRFSAIVKRDLVAFFRHWEYPLSDAAAATIHSFGHELWLPPGW